MQDNITGDMCFFKFKTHYIIKDVMINYTNTYNKYILYLYAV